MEGRVQIRTDDRSEQPEGGPRVEGAASTLQPASAALDDLADPMGEQEMLSASANAEFNRFKAEQRALLEKRNQTLKRIEAMRREYDFIQNLDARDVNYVIDKKREHAALIVQRNWRRLKAEREYLRAKKGMAREAHEYEKTEADQKRIQENAETLRITREHFKSSRLDDFYRKINEERNDILQEQV